MEIIYDEEFAKAVEEETKRLEQRIKEGKLQVTILDADCNDEGMIITPDQKKPHQFGYF